MPILVLALMALGRSMPPVTSDGVYVAVLIDELGHDDFLIREQAHRRLLQMGKAVLPCVRAALRHKDPEVRHRARLIVEHFMAEERLKKEVRTSVSDFKEWVLRWGSFVSSDKEPVED